MTGGSGGIGLAIAAALGRAGAHVTVAARREAELQNVCEALRQERVSCDFSVLDVTRPADVDAAVADAAPYDILVNNAGMNRPAPLVEQTDQDIDAIFDLNVKAALYVSRAVALRLLAARRPGSLINVSSQMGHVGSPAPRAVLRQQHAMEGAGQAGLELGAHGVRVNTICPTFIETPMTSAMFDAPGFRQWVCERIALGRVGRLAEIIGAAVFSQRCVSHGDQSSALMLDERWTRRTAENRPRARDVADLAQVSQSAVSRTFTPGASVSEEMRRKVLAAAQRLGYRPNALARSLITRQSRIVALVMSYLENQFYPLVIEKLSQKLQKEGYHVLMFIANIDEGADGVLADILQYQVDGIVLASAMLSPTLAKSCLDVGVPVVQFNRISDLAGLARYATGSGHLRQCRRRPHGGRVAGGPWVPAHCIPGGAGGFLHQQGARAGFQSGAGRARHARGLSRHGQLQLRGRTRGLHVRRLFDRADRRTPSSSPATTQRPRPWTCCGWSWACAFPKTWA